MYKTNPNHQIFQQLPCTLQAAIISLQDELNCSFDMALQQLLGTLSLVAGAKFEVQSPFKSIYPCNLYLIISAAPNMGKSRVFAKCMHKVLAFQSELQQEYRRASFEREAMLTIWEQQYRQLTKAINKVKNSVELSSLQEQLSEHFVKKPQSVVTPQIIYRDTTEAAFLSDMINGNTDVGLFSPEAGTVTNMMTLSFITSLNSFWSREAVSVNRKTTNSYIVDDVSVSILWLMQPEMFTSFMKKSYVRTTGFAARCLVSHIEHEAEKIELNPLEKEDLLQFDNFDSFIDKLLKITPPILDGKRKRTLIKCDGASCTVFDSFRRDLANKTNKGESLDSINDFIGKLPENVVRIAALLQLIESRDDFQEVKISSHTMSTAVLLGNYYLEQFHGLLGEKTEYEITLEAAAYLMDFLDKFERNNRTDLKVNGIAKSYILKHWKYRSKGAGKLLSQAIFYLQSQGVLYTTIMNGNQNMPYGNSGIEVVLKSPGRFTATI